MSYIVLGSVALGSYLLYKYVKNENINFTMNALKAHSLLKENRLYKSLLQLYTKRESIIVLSLEYRINEEIFIIDENFEYSVKNVKDKINKSYNVNDELSDLILDIKWTQYEKVYRTRVKYSDLDKLEMPQLTDKLYKDYILTGLNTLDKNGMTETHDVTDLLNEYAGPKGDFFRDNEYV